MKKDDVRNKIIEATNNGISLREIARYFGVSPTSVRRWRDGQRPKDPQNVLDGLSEMIGYAKKEDDTEPHEITVTFTPKFKIGDKVQTKGTRLKGKIVCYRVICPSDIAHIENCIIQYFLQYDKDGCGYFEDEWKIELDKPKWKIELDKPKWTFTENEKVILRNLPDEYKWIARDGETGLLWVYINKPKRNLRLKCWGDSKAFEENLKLFENLFQSVQWADDEPCEFRKYL